MGRTIPSYRMILEVEIKKWQPFRRALASKSEREAFDELMNSARLHADAAGMSVRLIPMEAVFMSMLLAHQKALNKIVRELGSLMHNLPPQVTQRYPSSIDV